jgi:small subunit ribosomal protein S20
MANSKQATKRAKQNITRYKLRHAQRSKIRTAIKAVRSSIDANNSEDALVAFKNAEKVIDTHANKNVIHKNTAARYKSRLVQAIKKIS